jgi:nitronate monooxygenase
MELSPRIIQGGMGAGVSSWRLARAVSSLGQLGVVSGVALEVLLARRLQDGDKDGSVRGALERFPIRETAERIYQKYFVRGGKPEAEPYRATPMHSIRENKSLAELCMVGNFVEVFLARQGHDNPVGINYLEKIQLPHLPSIYGAMLAGVACVIVGAGIAVRMPGVLDQFAHHEPASYEIQVTGASAESPTLVSFDPSHHTAALPDLERPAFLSIVSSNAVASTMVKRSNGRVDGFIVERFDAGGHNAPPRGRLQLDALGQPLYGEKDGVSIEKLRELGLPFWLAGGQARPENLRAALAMGASGIQVGTAFALCEESGLRAEYRAALLEKAAAGQATVFTDPLASPTGFPFKVASLEGTLSEPDVYDARKRVCDLGFLREAYLTTSGSIGYRCPAEPVEAWVAKGGDAAGTAGRKCLCNALLADIGLQQVRRDGYLEPPLITAGDDLRDISRFVAPGATSYTAREVVEALVAGVTAI